MKSHLFAALAVLTLSATAIAACPEGTAPDLLCKVKPAPDDHVVMVQMVEQIAICTGPKKLTFIQITSQGESSKFTRIFAKVDAGVTHYTMDGASSFAVGKLNPATQKRKAVLSAPTGSEFKSTFECSKWNGK